MHSSDCRSIRRDLTILSNATRLKPLIPWVRLKVAIPSPSTKGLYSKAYCPKTTEDFSDGLQSSKGTVVATKSIRMIRRKV